MPCHRKGKALGKGAIERMQRGTESHLLCKEKAGQVICTGSRLLKPKLWNHYAPVFAGSGCYFFPCPMTTDRIQFATCNIKTPEKYFTCLNAETLW